MKSKQVTIKDVAREAGVSVATVSRALNGLGGIGEDTREYVLQVCERLAYVPNTLARGLVMKHTQTIGIIMPDITSSFYSQLMVLATAAAKMRGYQVLLCNSSRNYEMEVNYFKLLIGNQVEGILFFPVGEQSAKNLYQFMRYVPVVALNRMPEGSPIPYVCADEFKGGKIAAERLIAGGCKNLLFIGLELGKRTHRFRAEGFLEAVKTAGIHGEVYDDRVVYRSNFERGYKQFCDFLDQETWAPDGVAAINDDAANGIIKACMERNIPVPEEMSVIGFDNINADLPMIELTTVSASHQLRVKKAIDLLIQMKGEGTIAKENKAIHLQPELIEKDSCRKPENICKVEERHG